MSSFLLDLWRNLFPPSGHSGGAGVDRSLVLPEPPAAPPPPEPSCFARGVARSIVEEPEQWVKVDDWSYQTIGYSSVLSVRHRTTGVCLGAAVNYHWKLWHVEGCSRISSVHIAGRDLSEADTILLAQTIEAHPLGQLKAILTKERREAERKAKAEAHFTNLGCPPASSTSPVSTS